MTAVSLAAEGTPLRVFAASILLAACLQGGNTCKAASEYDGKFAVRVIRIDTPLQFLGPVSEKVREVKNTLPLKERNESSHPPEPGLFSTAAFNAGIIVLRDHLGELKAWPDARIAGRLIAPPALENCNEDARTVDVVYRIYSLRVPSNLGHVVEGFGSQVSRALLPTGPTAALNQWKPRPFLGYDGTLRGFGGIEATLRGLAGPVREVNWLASGSSSSHLLKLGLAGNREIQDGPVAAVDWRVDYRNYNAPALEAQLSEAILSAQVAGVTRSLGDSAFVGRFGASVEGGHQQSEMPQSAVAPGSVLQAGTGAVKAYAGFSAQPGPIAAKASYAIQFGKASEGFQLDYIKHIWDARLSGRLPPLRHRQFHYDLQFGAGWIQRKGVLPAAERFFGGNFVQPFINGDTWVIRADPLMRSYPHNRLARTQTDGYLGGDGFVALNSTLGYMVWGKPLTPSEVTSDPDFPGILNLALSASRSELFDSHLRETALFKDIAQSVKKLEPQLASALSALLRVSQNASLDEDLKGVVESVRDTTIQRLAKFVQIPAEDLDVRGLVTDIPADPNDPDDISVDSLLKGLAKAWKNVERQLADLPALASEAGNIQHAREAVEAATRKAQEDFNVLEQSSDARHARKLAEQEMSYSTRILNQLFKEVNLVGITPVAFFDTGQLWQQSGGGGGQRYGLGGGVKLTFIALELTAGYAWNIHPRPWEGRGAFVLSFDLSNILR